MGGGRQEGERNDKVSDRMKETDRNRWKKIKTERLARKEERKRGVMKGWVGISRGNSETRVAERKETLT
jgi:hypothetical protein